MREHCNYEVIKPLAVHLKVGGPKNDIVLTFSFLDVFLSGYIYVCVLYIYIKNKIKLSMKHHLCILQALLLSGIFSSFLYCSII